MESSCYVKIDLQFPRHLIKKCFCFNLVIDYSQKKNSVYGT